VQAANLQLDQLKDNSMQWAAEAIENEHAAAKNSRSRRGALKEKALIETCKNNCRRNTASGGAHLNAGRLGKRQRPCQLRRREGHCQIQSDLLFDREAIWSRRGSEASRAV